MAENDQDWPPGTDAETAYRQLLERADQVLQLDARAVSLREIERRSASMVDGMRSSNFRRD